MEKAIIFTAIALKIHRAGPPAAGDDANVWQLYKKQEAELLEKICSEFPKLFTLPLEQRLLIQTELNSILYKK
jgi:hypothetical protein